MENLLEKERIHRILTQIANNMKNNTLMYYNVKDNGKSVFYFNGFPIIKTLSELPKSYRFKELKLMASASNQEYIFEDCIKTQKRLDDLIYFFNDNPEYSLDDLDGILQNDIEISIHDDSEITFSFPDNYNYEEIISKILEDYQYKSKSVINHLKTNKSKYLSIERPDSVLKIYANFKDFGLDDR